MTYTQQLEYLDLPSLWHRRLGSDMIQVFRIINGIDDINCEKFFEFTDYDGTIDNCIFNMLEHKVKNVLLVEVNTSVVHFVYLKSSFLTSF